MLVRDKIAERMIADKRIVFCRDCYRFMLNEKRFASHIAEGHSIYFLALSVDESYTQKTIEDYMKSLADRIKQLKVKHN